MHVTPQIDTSDLYCEYMSIWTERTQLLHARVSDPHGLPRQILTESEYKPKSRQVGRPFLDIFTEKIVVNASSVETHQNFAGVLVCHTVACEKNGDVSWLCEREHLLHACHPKLISEVCTVTTCQHGRNAPNFCVGV